MEATCTTLPPETSLGAQDALRIQVAAVAAQQANLTEEEIALQQRRQALEQQEQQLASHLEAKRQRLLTLREEARQAQTALSKDRNAYEERVATVLHELAAAREEVNDGQARNQAERQRLLTLRQRLKRRWHSHWAAERAGMRRQESDLAAQQRELEANRAQFAKEKASFAQAQTRATSELERSRRQLQAERGELSRAKTEMMERAQVLDRREAAVLVAEKGLAAENQSCEANCRRLRTEAEDLQSRIANYRQKLTEQQREAARLDALVRERKLPSTSSVPQPRVELLGAPALRLAALPSSDTVNEHRLVALETLEGELTDQRLHLAEECERLLLAQKRWQEDQADLAARLITLGADLRAREERILTREKAAERCETEYRSRAEELERGRRQFEASQSRFRSLTAGWEGERARRLAELRGWESELQYRQAALEVRLERWQERRRRQVLRFDARRQMSEQMRRECVGLRAELWQRLAIVEKQRQSLAAKTLALKQFQQEIISHASHAKATENQLFTLRRHWQNLTVGMERALARERDLLKQQADRMEERWRQIQQQAAELTAQETELVHRQTARDREELGRATEQSKERQELFALRRQRDLLENEVTALRAEIERKARLVLDADASSTISVARAA
jgi:chromosome segregation ATPase